MKKIIFLFLFLIMIVSGCNTYVYTVESGGVEYTVNEKEHSISDGKNIYYYSVDNYKMIITYPDNSSFYYAGGSQYSYSDDYEEGKYIDGIRLVNIINRKK